MRIGIIKTMVEISPYMRIVRARIAARRAFTLIELLVVIAIIAVLAVVVIIVLNPAQLLAQARDGNRLSDLTTVNGALGLYQAQGGPLSLGVPGTEYTSLPDASSTCGDVGLPSLPTSSVYGCVSSTPLRDTNGSGWIPVNFASISSGNPFSSLPVDPVNNTSSQLYYTYETDGTHYEVTANMESLKYKNICANAGGAYTDLCQMGTALTLLPIDYGIPPGYIALNTWTTMATTLLNQSTTLKFNGTAGQLVSVMFNNGAADTYPSNQAALSLLNPSGGTIASAQAGQGNSGGVVISGYSLPTTGIYTLNMLQTGSTAGQVPVDLLTYTNITGTIAFGATTTMSTSYLGQTDSLTFGATAGQTVSLSFNNGAADTYPSNQVVLSLLNTSGGTVASAQAGKGNSGGVVISGYSIPTTGTYTVQLTQNGGTAGQVPVNLIAFTNATGTIAFGPTSTMSAAYLGQTDSLTFSGTAGQTISLIFNNGAADTYPSGGAVLALLNPGLATVASQTAGQGNGGGVVISNYNLPTTGTYTVQLTQTGSTAGQVPVNLFTYTDATGTIAFGPTSTMSTAYLGQTDSLTFGATAGQLVSLVFDNGAADTYPSNQAMLALLNPSGGTVTYTGSGQGNSGGVLISGYSIPTTGTYTFRLTQTGSTAGQVPVNLFTYTDATGTIAFGATTTISTSYIGQTESLAFSATAGQTISVIFNNGAADTYPSNQAALSLLNPSGGTIANTGAGQGNSNGVLISGYSIPTTGTYTIQFTQTGKTAGQVPVELTSP